jgi:hypothetical protein
MSMGDDCIDVCVLLFRVEFNLSKRVCMFLLHARPFIAQGRGSYIETQ